MSRQAAPYAMPYHPIRLKRRLIDAGLSQEKVKERSERGGESSAAGPF